MFYTTEFIVEYYRILQLGSIIIVLILGVKIT